MEDTIAILLHVAFQDGFDDDTALVRIDGQEVYRREGLTTDTRIGVAASFERQIEPGSAEIEVELPNRNVRDRLRIDVTEPVYLAVSTSGAGLEFRLARERFGYA